MESSENKAALDQTFLRKYESIKLFIFEIIQTFKKSVMEMQHVTQQQHLLSIVI